MKRPSCGQFAAWIVVGLLPGLGLLAAFTPFVVIAVLPVLPVVALLARRGGVNASAWGAVTGIGIGPLVIAWLNRDGPGDVCSRSAGGVDCLDEWSPWPWASAGILLAMTGIGLYLLNSRRARGTDGR